MEYRSLGRTGVQVSPLCLGTMNFGHRTSESEAISIIHRAITEGINFIDTADFYGQPTNGGKGQGLTERIIGKALNERRNRIVLATKFLMPTDWDDPNAQGGSRLHVIQACEASLRRLNTDYIDLYQMHRPDPRVPIDETLRALDDLIRAGKVRYIGTSVFPAWKIMESLWTSKELHLNRFVTEQPRYNLLHREIERELVPMAQSYGIGILAYAPLLGGILSGKYRQGRPYPKDSRITDDDWGQWAGSFVNDEVLAAVDTLIELADDKNCTLSQLAIAWVINQPGISAAIIGPRTMDHLEDNVGALEVQFTEDELARLDKLVSPGCSLI
jgi:aryl-alcohol dehydrogenase-like predicted oxidoreductase